MSDNHDSLITNIGKYSDTIYEEISRENDALRMQIEDLIKRLDESDVENYELKEEIGKLELADTDLELDRDYYKSESERSEKDVDSLRNDVDERDEQIEKLTKHIEDLTVENDEKEKHIESLQSTCDILESTVSEWERVNDDLVKENDALRTENDDLRTRFVDLSTELSLLKYKDAWEELAD